MIKTFYLFYPASGGYPSIGPALLRIPSVFNRFDGVKPLHNKEPRPLLGAGSLWINLLEVNISGPN